MSVNSQIHEFDRFWKQTRLPVVFQRQRPSPYWCAFLTRQITRYGSETVKEISRLGTKKMELGRSHKLGSNDSFAYRLQGTEPATLFSFTEKRSLCPACWSAVGADCECSCMGANHSSGRPIGRWYEVSDTFAVMWGIQRYSARLLKSP